ncbi:MAG: FAD-dependent thymidylate synthase [Bacillota bacterium]|uniref:Flavin-dependent thymidylate synthase n=1 Tax=Thermanaerosceptrum fracticalcis TaxID=1712410 RepID=A0A7G6E5S0_THEFR|nr:FAD-dependent thymidylate synthase [Thermanaerosceptrum fracticalcis]QNB47424.1 FAD-dependent thymidylate synthase [Thermanaerosceptrum fracticalcis]
MGRKNMQVRLVRHTPAPEEIIAMGAKLCYSAVDVDKLESGIQEKDQGPFIEKLMKLGHLSPVEHASFTFAIEGVSRSLLAQITRHRIASFSVQSQRYVGEHSAGNEDGVFDYIVPPRIEALGEEYLRIFHEQMATIQKWYDFWNKALGEQGEQSQEDARFVLPNAAETKMLVTMNARELLHFFSLRCCNRAQWEIRELSTRMLKLAKAAAPNIFKNAGPGCLEGPCPEGKMTCGKQKEVKYKFAHL